MSMIQNLTRGLWKENPLFVLVLGVCPALAVTTTAMNGLGMGVATALVLVFSNLMIAALRNFIPDKVRIPAFLLIIASFVTMTDLLMQASVPALHESLGIFVPLIVVNCLILGRAEAFAEKNRILPAVLDGIGMGLGFTLALTLTGGIREMLGSGTVFNFRLLAEDTRTLLFFILPPGAFITYGYLVALTNQIRKKNKAD